MKRNRDLVILSASLNAPKSQKSGSHGEKMDQKSTNQNFTILKSDNVTIKSRQSLAAYGDPRTQQIVPDGRNYTSTTGFVVCLDFIL